MKEFFIKKNEHGCICPIHHGFVSYESYTGKIITAIIPLNFVLGLLINIKLFLKNGLRQNYLRLKAKEAQLNEYEKSIQTKQITDFFKEEHYEK